MSKVILITGGGSGLGKAIAALLSKENNVIILSRDETILKETAGKLRCQYEVCDIGTYEQVEKTINKIIENNKRIDVVINCAGLYVRGKISDNNSKQIEDVYRANTIGTVYVTKAVVPIMKKQKEGLIINVISQGGLPGFAKAERSLYYSSKMAITSFTKSISLELLPLGIRVTGLYPGKIHTDFMKKQGTVSDMSDAIDPEKVADLVRYIITLNSSIHIPEVGIKSSKQVS